MCQFLDNQIVYNFEFFRSGFGHVLVLNAKFKVHVSFADMRGCLIVSLSCITAWPKWRLQLCEINSIMYAVKKLVQTSAMNMFYFVLWSVWDVTT